MYCATDRTAGQAGCVEGTRGNPPPTTFSIISHNILADQSISRSGKLILLALLKFARQKGECFPAVGTLARAAGVSESTARRHLARLAEAGLLSIRQTKSNPTGRVIVLDFAGDPARHPALRVSNRQGGLGLQSASAVRVSGGKSALGCQTEAPVRSVEQKGENKPVSIPLVQRQRSEVAAMQLDLIGTVTRPTGVAVVTAQPAVAQAEPITPERARMVMAFTAKGGPLRESALKHLTPAMLAFMDAQGGEMSAFAKTFGRTTEAANPSPDPTNQSKVIQAEDVRIAAVMEAAMAIQRRSSPLLVDRLADRLISLFGDGGSRSFFCGIGHALRSGALDPGSLREAIDAGLGQGVKNPAALFTARIGPRLGGRRGGK